MTKIIIFLLHPIKAIKGFIHKLKPQPKLIAFRYLDLLFLTAVAGLLFYLIANITWVQIQAEKWADLVLSLPIELQCFLPFPLGLGLVSLLRWFGCAHQNHKFIDSLKYPPCYISGFLLASIIVINNMSALILKDLTILNNLVVTIVLFCSGAIIEFLLQSLKCTDIKSDRSSKDEKPEETSSTALTEDKRIEKILEWILEEKPSKDLDLFGAKEYADKISQRLKNAAKDNFSLTQAIIGPFGVGKSTIIQYCIENIKSDKEWIIVKVDAWGASGSNIASIILKRIISTLSEHFDMAELKSLPEQYLDSLNAAKQPHIMALVAALRDSESAKDKLEKLDNFLATVNRRLLIVIEDVDRHDEAKKHCNALASLLDNLRSLKRTSFILAVGFGSEYDEIFKRICLYRDYIPPITEKTLEGVVATFINILMSDEEQIQIGKLNLFATDRENIKKDAIISAISSLIQTPRELKNILRKTQNAWSVLRGEVDLEDLFILNAIYYTDSSYFEKIYISAANDTLSSLKKQSEKNSIAIIIEHLFHQQPDKTKKPQGIALYQQSSTYTFLRRCVFERLEESQDKHDQLIIKTLNSILDGTYIEKPESVSMLYQDDFALDRLISLNLSHHQLTLDERTLRIIFSFISTADNSDIECFSEDRKIAKAMRLLITEAKEQRIDIYRRAEFNFKNILKTADEIIELALIKSLHLTNFSMMVLSHMTDHESFMERVHNHFKTKFREIITDKNKLYSSIKLTQNNDELCANFLCSYGLKDIDKEYITWFLNLVADLQGSDSELASKQLFNIIKKLHEIYEYSSKTEPTSREEETTNKIVTLLGSRFEDIKKLMQKDILIEDLVNGDRASKIRKIFDLADS